MKAFVKPVASAAHLVERYHVIPGVGADGNGIAAVLVAKVHVILLWGPSRPDLFQESVS